MKNTANKILANKKGNISKRDPRSHSVILEKNSKMPLRQNKSVSSTEQKENLPCNKHVSKKKHNELIKIPSQSLIEKSKCSTLKLKIEDIFNKYTNNTQNYSTSEIQWKRMFRELFEKEKIVDFSSEDFLPKSLNNSGSYVMKLEKFWMLWVEIIKKELNLELLVFLVNNALCYLNDATNMKKFFNLLVKESKVTKKEIADFCQEHNIKMKDFSQPEFLLDSNCEVKMKNVEGKTEKNTNYQATNYSNCSISDLNLQAANTTENCFQGSNDTFKSLNCNNQTSVEKKFEASYLTIEETNNEISLNTTKLDKEEHNMILASVEKSEGKQSESAFIIGTPDIRKNSYSFNNIYSSAYEEMLVTFAKQGQVDTKSIVADIEQITATLKKEIENSTSPEIAMIETHAALCKDICCNPTKPDNSTNDEQICSYDNDNKNDSHSVEEKKIEDSYEKHLKETAEKRGEKLEEFIHFNDFKEEEKGASRGRRKTVSMAEDKDSPRKPSTKKKSKTARKSKSKSKSKKKSKSKRKTNN